MRVIITYQEGNEIYRSQFYFNNREQYNEEINYYLDDTAIGIDIIEDDEE